MGDQQLSGAIMARIEDLRLQKLANEEANARIDKNIAELEAMLRALELKQLTPQQLRLKVLAPQKKPL
jgi:hypothetical protein